MVEKRGIFGTFHEREAMEDKIRSLGERAHAELGAAVDAGALETWRVEHLGRKGALAALMTQLGAVPKEDRPRLGSLPSRRNVTGLPRPPNASMSPCREPRRTRDACI